MKRLSAAWAESIGGRTRRAVGAIWMSNMGREGRVVWMNTSRVDAKRGKAVWRTTVCRRARRHRDVGTVWMCNVLREGRVVSMDRGTCSVVLESSTLVRSRAVRSG
jgi:hypothetical protein